MSSYAASWCALGALITGETANKDGFQGRLRQDEPACSFCSNLAYRADRLRQQHSTCASVTQSRAAAQVEVHWHTLSRIGADRTGYDRDGIISVFDFVQLATTSSAASLLVHWPCGTIDQHNCEGENRTSFDCILHGMIRLICCCACYTCVNEDCIVLRPLHKSDTLHMDMHSDEVICCQARHSPSQSAAM